VLGVPLQKGKLCRCCKRFRHLAYNCRNKEEGKKGTIVPKNKFEVLRSKVMQCGVEERMIRRHEVVVVECFKCGEKGHKCKECLLWEKTKEERRARRVVEEQAACVARPQKMQQERKLMRPTREETQEGEKRFRRVEESEAAYHKWSLTICDRCFDTSKSSKMRGKASDKRCY